MTYNTGNPIGSTDARDRSDNSENMDILENSTTLNAHPDRLGTMRKTRKGMELEHDNQISAHEVEHAAQISAHEVEHDSQMQSFENDFDSRLAGMAFTRVGTFTTGATLTDMRQTLLWEVSQGGDGHEYGWTGSFLPSGKVVSAGSTPATSGGVGAGGWIDLSDVSLRAEITPSVTEALRRSYADAGYNLVDGSFESGGTLNNTNDVLLHKASGIAYSWAGAFPKVVPAGSTPATSGGIGAGAWVDRTQETLKLSLLSNSGASIVYTSTGATVEDRLSNQDTSIAGKASLAGSASQAFSVADATTDTQAASYGQVKSRTKKGGLTQSISGNALTLSYAARLLQFRNATLTDGTSVEATPSAAMILTVPNGATLGGSSGVPMEVLVLGIYNGGSPVIGVVNAGGLMLDESGLISTTAISASATSSAVVYSSVAVTNSPYIILNRLSVTLPTAGAWSVLPTVTPLDLISPSMLLRKVRSLPLPTTSGTTINVTGIPSWAKRISIIFDDVKTASASVILVQVGRSSIITTGYTSSSVSATSSGTSIETTPAGFIVSGTTAGTTLDGKMQLDILHNSVIEEHLVSVKGVGAVLLGGGKLALTGGVTQLMLTPGASNVGFSGGAITLVYEG